MESLRNVILGGALFMIATAVLGTPPADSTIEQLADAPKFVDPEPVAEPVKKPGAIWALYSDAHFVARDTGKLAIFIEMERCGPCRQAYPLFKELAEAGGYAAVVLDTVKDAELVAQIGKPGIAPQVVVYEKESGEWFQRSVIGNKPSEIKRVMAGENATPGGLILSTPGVARPCSCEKCPKDCGQNGCKCGKQSAGGCGAACESSSSSCASGNCGMSSGNRRGFGFRRR